jgi:membrane-bound ClpP family serine protease
MPDPTDRIIEYARPKGAVSASRVFAGVCSVPAGLLGIVGTILGLVGLVVNLSPEAAPTYDRPLSTLYAVVFLLIGLAALVASIRWGRYAIRRSKDGG